MEKTPRGMRLHIGVFGKVNVGKSSVINRLCNQDISIVSDIAGTTTDPVQKAMEMLPLGPVLLIDTAGIDDLSALGEKRIKKTLKIIDKTDLAIIVSDERGWNVFEIELLKEFNERKIPVISIVNKIDMVPAIKSNIEKIRSYGLESIEVSATSPELIDKLKMEIIKLTPDEFINPIKILSDIVKPKETAILVIPIDKEAPKGRIILPQVQAIRDLLDNSSLSLVVQETELAEAITLLKKKPALVVTDSQAFESVAKTVPNDILLTSFSTLFARLKGDLAEFTMGATHIDNLKDDDTVLITESCTHHPIGDDIGRIKLPNWLKRRTGKKLNIEVYAGHDFPEDLSKYSLIIQCGACMTNRREILSRIMKAKQANVPMTNYGLAIAFCLNIFERALEPYPEIKEMYLASKK